MLAQICALLVLPSGQPKDMAELSQLMNAAYAKLKGFEDDWKLTSQGTAVSYRRILDGDRHHFSVVVNGKTMLVSGSNGKNEYAAIYPTKCYYTEPDKKEWGKDEPVKPQKGNYQFNITENSFSISSDPPLQIRQVVPAMLEGRKVRHVVAETSNPETGGRLRMDLLFWPDAWILCRATVTLTKKGQKPEVAVHTEATVRKGLQFRSDVFKLDPKSLQGFKRVSKADIVKAMSGGGG